MNKNRYFLLGLFIIILTLGCTTQKSNTPHLIEQSVQPSFVSVSEQTRVGYVVSNPLEVSFVGTTEIKYNEKCLTHYRKIEEIEVPPSSSVPYFFDLTVKSDRDGLNKECIGETPIQVVLKDKSDTLLDVVSVKVNIVQ